MSKARYTRDTALPATEVALLIAGPQASNSYSDWRREYIQGRAGVGGGVGEWGRQEINGGRLTPKHVF